MRRDADRARLSGNRAINGLANPPCGVGAEFIAAPRIKLSNRAHQANITVLDQIEQRDAASKIFFGHADH